MGTSVLVLFVDRFRHPVYLVGRYQTSSLLEALRPGNFFYTISNLTLNLRTIYRPLALAFLDRYPQFLKSTWSGKLAFWNDEIDHRFKWQL
jgi:hypothetical protein